MFNFNFDRKTLYIILGALLLLSIVSMGTDGLLSILLTLPGVIIAITFHEFAHAYSAYKLGDNTPKYQGRLNLNPLSHMDPIGFFMLIVAHFGWGKPVEINSRNFNGKYSLSASEAIVAIAGPIMNFILAVVFALILGVLVHFMPATFVSSSLGEVILTLIQYTVIVNIGLGVFNLIPLPPLDGSKVLMHFLPYNGKVWMSNNEGMFSIVFLLLWVTGIAGKFIAPIINVIYTGLIYLIGIIF